MTGMFSMTSLCRNCVSHNGRERLFVHKYRKPLRQIQSSAEINQEGGLLVYTGQLASLNAVKSCCV